MADLDIRWKQRLENFNKALHQLSKFIEKGELNELEEQGLIQSFEYTYELSWNTIKDYFEAQGETGIHGSRDAFRLAFQRGVVENGDQWMEMIKSRVLTSHGYDQTIAAEIVAKIKTTYFAEFQRLQLRFQTLAESFGLPSSAIKDIRAVLDANSLVERAVLYGSRALGTHKPGSDIDIALFGPGLNHHELTVLMHDLDELLLPWSFDLSLFDHISHENVRDHILRVGVELFRR